MKLLLVEDEVRLAKALQTILNSEGYTTTLAFDGEEGLKAAQQKQYDLILLDINLPKKDGLTLCSTLRQEGTTTPIIMLTARDMTSDRVTGLDAGADDYLVKPFETSELLARIRAQLRRTTNTLSVLSINDLTIDTKAETVKRAGIEISLSAKEYALLNYLAQRADQLVTKDELMQEVWGMAPDPDSNVVDVYVGYVRKKIDKAFPKTPPLLALLFYW